MVIGKALKIYHTFKGGDYMSKPFFKRKTTWAGIAAAITAIGSCLAGEIELGSAIQTVAISLIGIFIRDSIDK